MDPVRRRAVLKLPMFARQWYSCSVLLQMSRDSFNRIYDRCTDPSRGKLTGKFTFQDFVTFMEEYRQKLNAAQRGRLEH